MAQSFASSILKPTSSPSTVGTLFLLITLCTFGLYTLLHRHPTPPYPASQNALRFRKIFISSATNYTLSSYLRNLTLHPHLAGTPPAAQTVLYVQSHFANLGLDTHINDYSALLSYPKHSSLSAHFSGGNIKELPLAESGWERSDVVLPYHAYSPSGSVYGQAVFVNYGREEDYRTLEAKGVSVAGMVAVARRGKASRNAVVKKASEKGAGAVLMFTETEAAEQEISGGVEKGTVMGSLGDPLTPGWAAIDGGERLGLEDSDVLRRFPKIPSMPISVGTAEFILRSLEGTRVPYEWRVTLKSKIGRIGPGSTMLNFTYQISTKLLEMYGGKGVQVLEDVNSWTYDTLCFFHCCVCGLFIHVLHSLHTVWLLLDS